jgi:hypothetical protein
MKKTFITIIATTIVILIAQNMGINVDQPTEALDVDGNIKLTGAVKYADGSQQESAPASMPAGVKCFNMQLKLLPNGWLLKYPEKTIPSCLHLSQLLMVKEMDLLLLIFHI